jgi:hypothetical protein
MNKKSGYKYPELFFSLLFWFFGEHFNQSFKGFHDDKVVVDSQDFRG